MIKWGLGELRNMIMDETLPKKIRVLCLKKMVKDIGNKRVCVYFDILLLSIGLF